MRWDGSCRRASPQPDICFWGPRTLQAFTASRWGQDFVGLFCLCRTTSISGLSCPATEAGSAFSLSLLLCCW